MQIRSSTTVTNEWKLNRADIEPEEEEDADAEKEGGEEAAAQPEGAENAVAAGSAEARKGERGSPVWRIAFSFLVRTKTSKAFKTREI